MSFGYNKDTGAFYVNGAKGLPSFVTERLHARKNDYAHRINVDISSAFLNWYSHMYVEQVRALFPDKDTKVLNSVGDSFTALVYATSNYDVFKSFLNVILDEYYRQTAEGAIIVAEADGTGARRIPLSGEGK